MEEYLHGEWFWESGFDVDPINGLERIRDHNFRAVYGAITALKKGEPAKYANYDLSWLAYIGGTRESRRLVGDMILAGEDMVKGVVHPDACVPTTWDQGPALSKEQYMGSSPGNPFISRAEFGKHTDRKNGYPVPYRCLYSQGRGQPVHGRPQHLCGPLGTGQHTCHAHLWHVRRGRGQGRLDRRASPHHPARCV